jgi:D-arabinose 1-dehydrogenase-like Zn-dependent alcohol dehydrogenase
MKAVQVNAPNAEFELVTREIPEPAAGEIRIKVEACGVCHGDAIVKEGVHHAIDYPRIPGHEVVGVVDKLGPGVRSWKTGQRVGIGWYGGPCKICEACVNGEYQKCINSLITGISFDGGYAEYMVADARAFMAMPEELGALEAAPLLCAGRTTFSALRSSGARGGDTVAVQGMGGLGHLAVQFARKMGFYTVAISRGREKEALAYKLGAHAFIDSESSDPSRELKEKGGAQVILCTAPDSKAITSVVGGLRENGQMIVVAAPDEPVSVFLGQLFGGQSIKGWASRRPESKADDVLNFSVITGALPMIEVFPLERAAEAYEKMMTSKVHFRAVLKVAD